MNRHRKSRWTWGIVLCLAAAGFAEERKVEDTPPAVEEQADEFLVGAVYFSGWWRELPNKYHVAGRDWRPEYPQRRPLLGEFNDQATMDREIAAAADFGIDFFQILWYDQTADPPHEPHQARLNVGLTQFMRSEQAPRLRFTIEYVNHPPFGITSDELWEQTCRTWIDAMRHPSYLQLDGRPVFKIHSTHHFLQQADQETSKVSARIETFRRMVREAGMKDPLIGGGTVMGWPITGDPVAPYDFLTTYMDMPKLEPRETPYPYSKLVAHAEGYWRHHAREGERPYVPYLPAGWDPRPWKDPRPAFAMPTREEWGEALSRVKQALIDEPRLGIHTGGGQRFKAVLIYAWNEFGEGGILAPTAGEGTMKLEGVREIFDR